MIGSVEYVDVTSGFPDSESSQVPIVYDNEGEQESVPADHS